jgi:hypothetical protein
VPYSCFEKYLDKIAELMIAKLKELKDPITTQNAC